VRGREKGRERGAGLTKATRPHGPANNIVAMAYRSLPPFLSHWVPPPRIAHLPAVLLEGGRSHFPQLGGNAGNLVLVGAALHTHVRQGVQGHRPVSGWGTSRCPTPNRSLPHHTRRSPPHNRTTPRHHTVQATVHHNLYSMTPHRAGQSTPHRAGHSTPHRTGHSTPHGAGHMKATHNPPPPECRETLRR
jgi:hypothetical protein